MGFSQRQRTAGLHGNSDLNQTQKFLTSRRNGPILTPAPFSTLQSSNIPLRDETEGGKIRQCASPDTL
jgi:hypothetical protein